MPTSAERIAPVEDLKQVADLLRGLFAEGREDDLIGLVVDMLLQLRNKNTDLELRLHKLLKERFGRKGEGVSSAQLSLFMEILNEEQTESQPDNAEPATEGDDGDDDVPTDTAPKKRNGRKELPRDLPREVEWVPVPDEERTCPQCGEERSTIGHESSEVLELVPAHFKVIEVQREKLACRSCEELGVTTAPVPPKVFAKGLPGPSLVSELLINKYQDHLPLYRQQKRFSRMGVQLARSTLCDWVGASAELLRPVANALRRLVLQSHLLQTDSTHIKVLDRSHEANIRRGALYCYVGDGRHVYFDYTRNEKKESPHAFLSERRGYVQCDAATVFDGVFVDSEAIEVGCWMHARRKFVDALEAGDLRAAYPVKLIKRMYKAESKLKQRGASDEEVLNKRNEYTRPLLDELHRWIAPRYELEAPSLPLTKAMGYAIRQWEALNRFLDDPRLGPDNGEPERRIRGVALGRKNHLFLGSDAGGERAAIIYSLLSSCALNDVEPRAYMRDILIKLSQGWPQNRMEEIVPARWMAPQEPDPDQIH